MNDILHIASKDFRHLYRSVGGCYGLVLFLCGLLTLAARGAGSEDPDPLNPKFYLGGLGLYLILGSVVLVRLIQDDAVIGSTAFWLTRPISRSTLLASKLFFAGLAFVLLPTAIESAVFVLNGLSLRDLLQHLPGMLSGWLLLTLPVLALASLTVDYGRFARLFVATVAGQLLVVSICSHLDEPNPSAGILTIVWAVLTIAVSVVVLAHQFLTRKRVRSLVLGAVGLVAIVAGSRLWLERLGLPQLPSLRGPEFEQVRASMKLTSNQDEVASGDFEIAGIPPGYIARPVKLRRRAVASSESQGPFQYGWAAYFLNRSPQGPAALKPILGDLKLLNPPVIQSHNLIVRRVAGSHLIFIQSAEASPGTNGAAFVNLFSPQGFGMTVESPLDERIRASTGATDMEAVLMISKLQTGATIPARLGAHGQDIEFTQVVVLETRFSSKSVKLHLLVSRPKDPLTFRPRGRRGLWLLRNSKRNEALVGDEIQTGTFGLAGWMTPLAQAFSIERTEVEFWGASNALNLDAGWLDGAELVWIRAIPAGYVARPVDSVRPSS